MTLKKKILLFLTVTILAVLFLFSQEKMEATVAEISVSARVTAGGRFVDHLTIEDFELLEDGRPQNIQALYLVKRSSLEKRGGTLDFGPNIARNFYFLFQLTDYTPKLGELIDTLFNQVLLPSDSLVLQTPLKSYSLTPQALATKSKEALSQEMNSLLKKDIKSGNTEYHSLLNDLKRFVRTIAGTSGRTDIESDSTTSMTGIEFLLNRYKETSARMEEQRLIDERKFVRFAYSLKRVPGQKHVFFVYQREYRPEIPSMTLNMLLDAFQDQPNIMSDLQDLFQLYSRDISLNTELLNRAFADSSIIFNLIFMNREPEHITGITMREQSEDFYRAFSQMAQATGGIVDTSQNPAAGFHHAVESSDSYYLLYYTPANPVRDKQFKKITVRVKNPEYSVVHRLGYFAE